MEYLSDYVPRPGEPLGDKDWPRADLCVPTARIHGVAQRGVRVLLSGTNQGQNGRLGREKTSQMDGNETHLTG